MDRGGAIERRVVGQGRRNRAQNDGLGGTGNQVQSDGSGEEQSSAE